MQDAALADRVVAEKPSRLLAVLGARRASCRFFADAMELVVEHPLSVNLMVRVASHDRSLQFPGANHVIYQIVAPFARSPRLIAAEQWRSRSG
jgi:hypothetical protein